MMYNVGQYVVYGTAGVCKIVGFEKKKLGNEENDYCRLEPLGGGCSVYYIPSGSLETRVREMHSKEQIMALLAKLPSVEPIEIEDFRKRKAVFSTALKGSDVLTIFSMIKRLHSELDERTRLGKKLNLTDEKLMKDALDLVCQEFSVSLGEDKQEICERILKLL